MALEIILFIVGLIIGIVLTYLFFQERIKNQFQKLQVQFEQWKQEMTDNIREETKKRMSQAIKGRVGERFAPLLPMFEYEIADARFIGDPIDFIVFDGHSAKDLQKVVFVEVKTGKTKKLTKVERQIRDLVQEKKVEWELCHINPDDIEKETGLDELADEIVSEVTDQETSKAYSFEEIRKEYPKAYEPWTKEEDDQLKTEFNNGKSIDELAKMFQRKPSAIRDRLRKLELTKS